MSTTEKIIQAIEQGAMDQIQSLTTEAIEKDSVADLYALLDSLYQVGFNQESKQVALHLHDVTADDELNIILAEIAFEDGADLEGLDYLQQISATSNTYPQSLLVQADYYQSNGLPEVSEQKLKEAENLLPDEPVIQFALAELYFYMQKESEAATYYEKLLDEGIDELAGTSITSRLAAIQGMQGDFEEAVAHYEKEVKEHPHIDTHFQLGFLYYQQKEYEAAEAELKEVLALDPNYWAVYPLLVQIYRAQNDLKQALEAANLGIQRDELNEDLWIMRAEIKAQLDDTEAARTDFKQAIELAPEKDSIYLNYVAFLDKQQDDTAIVELIEQAPASIQHTPEISWQLALAYEALEQFDEASAAFVQVAAALQTDPLFLHDYYDFLVHQGNLKRAVLVGQRYLQLNPQDYTFEEDLRRLQGME